MPRISDLDLSLTDGTFLLLLVPVCLYLAYLAYGRTAPGSEDLPARVRWVGWLRGACLLLVLALLMEPVLGVQVRQSRKALTAVLVDDSESMRTTDGGISRVERAKGLLRGGALSGLARSSRMRVYRFSESLEPLPAGGVDSMRFEGRATDLAGALDALRDSTAGEGLVGAVLITDGGHNLGGRPERAAADLGVALIGVGVGDPRPPADAAVVSAVVDPLGYVGQDLDVAATVRAAGLRGATHLLQVTQEGRVLDARPVVLEDGEQEVRLRVRPDRPGRQVYRIGMAPLPEEASERNNEVVATTQVLPSRRRAILAGGAPSADLAYLRRILESDPHLDVTTVVASRPDQMPLLAQALARPEGLDLVVLVDVPGHALRGEPGQRLAAYVRSGGGLLMACGGDASGPDYADSGLPEVLPFRLSGVKAPEEGPFVPEVVEAEALHPILRLSDDPIADREAWAQLPPVLAYRPNAGAAADAVVLLVHPGERVDGRPMPMAAVRSAGRGKTMAVSFSTFWRQGLMMWGAGQTDRVSRAFWANAARWLTTPESASRLLASVDRAEYRSGEAVRLSARVLDELQQPVSGAHVTVSVTQADETGEYALHEEGEGRYTGQFLAGGQGDCTYVVRAGAAGEASGHFTVSRYSLEFEDVRMRAEVLQAIADASGGALVAPDSLAQALEHLNLEPQAVSRAHRWRLWGHPWLLGALIALLCVEWTVRRRRGMV